MQGRPETSGCDETGNRQSFGNQGTARGRSCSDFCGSVCTNWLVHSYHTQSSTSNWMYQGTDGVDHRL